MVNDKDIRGVLQRLPKEARYYFTAASVPRALAPEDLQALASSMDYKALLIRTSMSTHRCSQGGKPQIQMSSSSGGSNFLISDLLADFSNTDIN